LLHPVKFMLQPGIAIVFGIQLGDYPQDITIVFGFSEGLPKQGVDAYRQPEIGVAIQNEQFGRGHFKQAPGRGLWHQSTIHPLFLPRKVESAHSLLRVPQVH